MLMNIHENLEILKKVQEIDREIYRVRQELAQIPEAVQELTRQFEAEKTQLTQLENEVKNVQLRQKQKEGELSEKESLIRKYDTQLSQVKTNKEYSALQQEIASLKADGSLLEDQILGVFDEIERAQKKVKEERERLTSVEKNLKEKKAELEGRAETLKKNLLGLSERRLGAVNQTDPEIRGFYDKIVEKKEGLALVPVEGEACGGCRMEIRPQLLNELKLKENLVICENCSRILYTD